MPEFSVSKGPVQQQAPSTPKVPGSGMRAPDFETPFAPAPAQPCAADILDRAPRMQPVPLGAWTPAVREVVVGLARHHGVVPQNMPPARAEAAARAWCEQRLSEWLNRRGTGRPEAEVRQLKE